MKLKSTILFISSIFIAGLLQAQESVNTSGGDATGSGGTAAYSIGQIDYTTNTGSSGSAAQGVQQPYEIFTIGINETTLDISVSVFPNPTTENLILQINNFNNEKLAYQLCDTQGKLINNGQIITQQTQINMSGLPTATYFVNVISRENKKIQSFKIIKTQ